MIRQQVKSKKRASYFCMVSMIVFIALGYSIPVSATVVITPDQTIAAQFTRHTVTGITTPLPVSPNVPGFIGASYLTIGDLNNDGIKEIICTSGVGEDGDFNTHDGAVALFTWDGTNLDNWKKSVINATFAFPNETFIHDMNGDGYPDIVVMDNFIAGWSTRFVAGIYYLENQGGDITQSSNWIKRTIFEGAPDLPTGDWFSSIGKSAYHRAVFMDVDGDGNEDFITTKIDMEIWQNPPSSDWWTNNYYEVYPGSQYTWMEVFRKENAGYVQTDADGTTGADGTYPGTPLGGTAYGYSRHVIGDGGGFMFNMVDIDGDGNPDIVAPQFFIQTPGTMLIKGPGDPSGDSICWFKNPGKNPSALNPWPRYIIDNWYTSPNPTGRTFEVIAADIDRDGRKELIVSTHNHQDFKPDSYTYPPPSLYHRIWPSGIFYFEIPDNPTATSQWTPISFDTGNPNLNPLDAIAVANDVYAVDRNGGPYSQGSPGTVRAADINGDGYPELVVPGDGKGALYYYESVGALNYKRAALYKDKACMPGDAKIVDINNDGRQDIVAVIYDTSYLKPPPNTNKLKSSSIFVFENKTVPTVIELASFSASPAFKKVTLQWQTASEVDNVGFNIYRSETEAGQYTKINSSLITAKGSSTQGASYSFVDTGVKNRTTYYYKIEDVDLAGNSTFHGPISAKPSLFAAFNK